MNNWTREETIIAFNLYCKIPFKNSSKTHPMIIEFAKLIGRTPSALNMKIGNIGRLDPDLKKNGISGLSHGAKVELEVWDEFKDNPEELAYESERLIAEFSNKIVDDVFGPDLVNLPEGEERLALVKQRINQSFFRSAVMSSYNFQCCISGVRNPQLLEACHIMSWSQDNSNRMNPKNGLCLNSFFHRAYDSFLMTISPDLKVIISDEMIESTANGGFREYLKDTNETKIILPDKFLPEKEFLSAHFEKFHSKY